MASSNTPGAEVLNQAFWEQLNSGMVKNAADSVSDFTRVRIREDGVYRRVIPPLTIQNSDLTPQVHTDTPCKVCEKEPGSPAAVSVPFGTNPTGFYIQGNRYLVSFNRIMTPLFIKDADELRTYVMDIRQIISDNAVRDILAEEDGKFLSAVNSALIGADATVPWSGVAQWETIGAPISRESLEDAFSIMPRTDGHFEVATVLCNNVTIRQVQKFGRDEMGGDFSQEVFRKGWSETEFMNARWIISIKRNLIPDNSCYFFGDPRAIGKSFVLEEPTMFVDRRAFMIEFFLYECIGGAIGDSAALARADFQG